MSWIGGMMERESLPVLEASMAMASQRQIALANNIANVDTPHYQRQVLPEESFRRSLSSALREREERHWNEFSPSSAFRLSWDKGQPVAETFHGQDQGPLRHDDVNVNIEKEMGDMAKNTLYLTALQRLYKNQTSQWMSALRDRVA